MRNCLTKWVFAVGVAAALAGCGGDGFKKAEYRDSTSVLRSLAQGIVAKAPSVANVAITISLPGGSNWSVVEGKMADGTPVTADQPWRSASIGKMVMAATVLRLAETGKLSLDAPVSSFLSPEIMSGLHVINGVDRSNAITVRQLLSHTSGLPDYFEDGEPDANGLSPFKQLLLFDPMRLWNPVEPITWAKANLTPVNQPGEGYHYSDTGYQLLGLVVEAVSGETLHDAYRKFVFQPAGMTCTSLEWREAPRTARPLLSVFQGDLDLTEIQALSSEWGGGSLVTTGPDFARFLHALFEGRLLSPTSLQKMRDMTPASGGEYGLGLMQFNLNGHTVFGHMGYYGSFAFYDPITRVAYAGTLNQATSLDLAMQLMLSLPQVVEAARIP